MPKSELRRLLPDAPQALIDILDCARGSVQPPIRSEIFGSLRFTHNMGAASVKPTGPQGQHLARKHSFPACRSNIDSLREAYFYISAQVSTGYDISPAGQSGCSKTST